jgi:hypothetical protein
LHPDIANYFRKLSKVMDGASPAHEKELKQLIRKLMERILSPTVGAFGMFMPTVTKVSFLSVSILNMGADKDVLKAKRNLI